MNTVTEAEAITKRCPNGFDRCIATDCMAWRWEDAGFEIERVYSEQENGIGEFFPVWPEGDWEICDPTQLNPSFGLRCIAYRRPWGDRRKGFCGLCEPRLAYVEAP
jgi:hypothetical protein